MGPAHYPRERGRDRRGYQKYETEGRYSLECPQYGPPQEVSSAAVQRIWKAYHLQPHRVEHFKFSSDPEFVSKVRDIIGLYLNPPDQALVFSLDEKSQIRALDRTQPILPLRPGLPERQTRDYERHGTTTLFAALNVLDGTVIGYCQQRHRHQEFLHFLDRLQASVDPASAVHIILDNYGTHKHPQFKNWFAAHPRYHPHFTPTGSSWLNQIERSLSGNRRQTYSPRYLPQPERTHSRHRKLHSREQQEP